MSPNLGRLLRGLAVGIMSLFIVTCGIKPGPTACPTDATPSGSSVAQGNFTGVNGQTASGSAAIYSLGGGSYTVHLESITLPSETNLQMESVTSSGTLPKVTLRATCGSQNYTATVGGAGVQWTQINIYSANGLTKYAQALLQ